MAGPAGKSTDPVDLFQALEKAPWDHGFFQALRRIEVAFRTRLGEAARPSDEPLRLGQEPTLTFAPATLARFTPGDGERPARMAVQFFGLFGPHGPLPLHLTEYARERIRDDHDPAFSRFADVFHHRMLMLFYRAWASAEPVRSCDRPEDDDFARQVSSLIGLGLPGYDQRNQIPDQLKRHFAGRFAMPTRNAEGLQALLAADLGVPVRIQQFVSSWVTIPPPARWRLGPGKQAGHLGQSAILGGRVWQCDQKFRIVLGPLEAEAYEDFLPGGKHVPRVQAMVQSYIGDELDWQLQLVAAQRARPALALGKGRLGWNAWLGPRPHVRAEQDVVYEPTRAAA
jgi:type VI secretion system protein ImpH